MRADGGGVVENGRMKDRNAMTYTVAEKVVQQSPLRHAPGQTGKMLVDWLFQEFGFGFRPVFKDWRIPGPIPMFRPK